MKIRRRTFLQGAGAATAAAVLGNDAYKLMSAGGSSSLVYSAYNPAMTSGWAANEAWVGAGLDACVRAMTGLPTVGQAWESLFPGITDKKKIAIKINCLDKAVSPQFATVRALVEGLTQMLGGHFPAANIALFDNGLGRMPFTYGAPALASLGIVFDDPLPPYAAETFLVRAWPKHPALQLMQADYGISLAPLKRHETYGGGITGVIKNMMGACSESQTDFLGAEHTFHDAAPYRSFVDLFQNYMRAKLQVFIVDMTFAAPSIHGPWHASVNRITVGTDPCAVDAYVADVLTAIGISGATKGVPFALESAGLGTTKYTLVEPPLSLATIRNDIDRTIGDFRSGRVVDADVRRAIERYRGS